MDGSVGQNSQFEYDTLWDTQPVKADKRGSDMLRPSDTEDEEQCSSVLDRLKTLDEVGGKSEQDAVAIVQSRQYYSAIIGVWNTAVGTCRRMARSWRRTAKHRDAVSWT